MNKAVKITLSIILDMLLIILLICAFGFTIGGEKNINYYTFSLICSILISLGTVAFTAGVSYIKNANKKTALVVVAIAVFIIMIWGYNPMNGFTKSNDYIEYETEIIKTHKYRGEPEQIYFINQKEDVITINYYHDIWYDDEKTPEVGKTIVIREYEGGFGFIHYDWVEFKE